MIKNAGKPNSIPPAAGREARPFSVRAQPNRQMLPIPASGRDTRVFVYVRACPPRWWP